MQILRIDSSTNGASSVSRELTQAMLDHFKEKHPDANIIERDLGTMPLAHLNPVTTGAIRLPQDQHTDDMAAAFGPEREVLDEFLASDIVIVGAPLYNFTIPSALKSWIDRLGVAGVTFKYDENGPVGLAGGRRVIVASAQGGQYGDEGATEHQESLLKTFFGFIGIDDLEIVRVDKVGFGEDVREAGIKAAKEQIAKL
ncbi:FMN-dependent NADH-azoreductase [Croceicoccus sp. YJ47]|uniref:FMN-dependent NADH-azoreductase n=1 Tax=Croceicoccus sp. YJ47 TaxID=2798724 RepID=UPI0019236568|nr:NAD(P)H-dependent oxidoreductase [Croceicoccus sp. YJ47]QQN73843.1 NAD(P)H-dependent oxidoreductase [Croceicoccus sp. YJ47]